MSVTLQPEVPPGGPSWMRDRGAIPVGSTLAAAAVLAAAGLKSFFTPAESKLIAELDAAWLEAREKLDEFGSDRVRAEYKKRIAEGDPRTLEELTKRAELARLGLKERCREICREASPTVEAAVARFGEAAKKVFQKQLEKDRAECERLGIPVTLSPLAAAAHFLAARCVNYRVHPSAGCRPANLLPWCMP